MSEDHAYSFQRPPTPRNAQIVRCRFGNGDPPALERPDQERIDDFLSTAEVEMIWRQAEACFEKFDEVSKTEAKMILGTAFGWFVIVIVIMAATGNPIYVLLSALAAILLFIVLHGELCPNPWKRMEESQNDELRSRNLRIRFGSWNGWVPRHMDLILPVPRPARAKVQPLYEDKVQRRPISDSSSSSSESDSESEEESQGISASNAAPIAAAVESESRGLLIESPQSQDQGQKPSTASIDDAVDNPPGPSEAVSENKKTLEQEVVWERV